MPAKKWSKEKLIEILRAEAIRLGRTPRQKDFSRATDSLPDYSAFRKRFGNFSKAVIAAGFVPYKQTISLEQRRKISQSLKGRYKYPAVHDFQWLKSQHLELCKPATVIAQELDCHVDTVRRALRTFEINQNYGFSGHHHSEESKNNIREKTSGPNSCHWKGGVSKENYPSEFDANLRSEIRNRDNYICQLCGKTQQAEGRRLSVHHIDYDKTNNQDLNLITLCRKCNGKVNRGRLFWEASLKELQSRRKTWIKNSSTTMISSGLKRMHLG